MDFKQKYLGKITSAEFGRVSDRPFLMGLKLCFEFSSGGCCDGYVHTNNMEWSKHCEWTEESRDLNIVESQKFLYKILNDAKCNNVSELVGKPIEITIENNCYKEFRILTEVL